MAAVEDLLHPLLGAYVRSPQWVKSSLGRIYAALPTSLTRGAQYAKFQSEAEDTGNAVSLGVNKLRSMLAWSLSTVPAFYPYRSLASDLADPVRVLRQLPVLGKEELRRDISRYLSTAMPSSSRLRNFTGGSTTVPLEFFLQRGVSRPKEYGFMEQFHARVGMCRSDLVAALRGRSVPSAGRGGRLWMHDPIKRQLMFSCDHLVHQWMPEYINALRTWKPRFIQAYPSALYPIARWLDAHPDASITDPLKGVMLYSENVYLHQMDLFRRVFGCPVLKHYGHSERVLMGASTDDDDRYFFWPQYGHIELVAADGTPILQPGILGEIVGTGFDNLVLPFVRYRTGDLGMWSASGHPLLPGYPAIERIEGRVQEFVVCRDGRMVSITTLGAAHFSDMSKVEMIQYEQRVPGKICLNVVAGTRIHAEVKNAIAAAIAEKTQGGCDVEIVQVNDIARTTNGKHRMLIQHIDLTHFYKFRREE